MEDLWRVSFGLTGISGVVAFVLWSLYKDWLQVPVLHDLTKIQKYNLLKLFLILTFVFAIAGLLFGGFQKYLESGQSEVSAGELENMLKSKFEYGESKFLELKRMDLSMEDKQIIEKLSNDYTFFNSEALEALENQEYVRSNLFYKRVVRLLETAEAQRVFDIYLNEDDRLLIAATEFEGIMYETVVESEIETVTAAAAEDANDVAEGDGRQ